jgi:hypothetical protein
LDSGKSLIYFLILENCRNLIKIEVILNIYLIYENCNGKK